jgi:hypothetical protein
MRRTGGLPLGLFGPSLRQFANGGKERVKGHA